MNHLRLGFRIASYWFRNASISDQTWLENPIFRWMIFPSKKLRLAGGFASHVWSREAPALGLSIFVMVKHGVYFVTIVVSCWSLTGSLGHTLWETNIYIEYIDVWFLVAFVAFPTILNWNTHEYHMNIMNTHGECLGNPRWYYLRHGGFSMVFHVETGTAPRCWAATGSREAYGPCPRQGAVKFGWWMMGLWMFQAVSTYHIFINSIVMYMMIYHVSR